MTVPTAAFAQSGSAPPNGVSSKNWFENSSIDELTIPVSVGGAPGTFQVISIPIPSQLPKSATGAVELVPREGFTVIGVHRWPLTSLSGKRSVLGVIGVSSRAGAGKVTAADVTYGVAGSPTVSLLVQVDVGLVRGLNVRVRPGPVRMRAGSQTSVAYTLVNDGNSVESVRVQLQAPTGWKATHSGPVSESIKPGESIERRFAVTIPRQAGTGSFSLRLDVLDDEILRSRVPIAVDVRDSDFPHMSSGPEITVAVGRSLDGSGRGNTMMTASARGALFDSVSVDAQMSVGDKARGPHVQGLSRVGSYSMNPSLAFSTPRGRVSFGDAGNSFSDLTGLNAHGTGTSLDIRGKGWSLIGIGALSNTLPYLGKRQPMAAFRADVDAGPVTLMSSISHLRSGTLSSRQLDAASIGVNIDAGFNTAIKGEIARRGYLGGSGTGWSGEVARVDSRNSFRIALIHAPGGSDAFARALNQVVASVTQTLTQRLSIGGGAWRLSDVTAAFSSLRTKGWSIRPEYRLRPGTAVTIEAHSAETNATARALESGGRLGFGASEKQLGAGVSSSVGRFSFRGSVAAGTVSRTIAAKTGTAASTSSPRIIWNSSASWRNTKNTLQFQQKLDETRDPGGAVLRQGTISIRGDRLLSTVPGRGVVADWEVQHVSGFSARSATIVRTGISIPLSETLAFKVYAEHNPLFSSRSGRAPWIYAMRVEQTARAPMLRQPGISGYVYRDLNGNGRRDDGEAGIAGVIVSRNDATAVTDAGGRYRLAGDKRSPVVLDETSIPLGWIRQGNSLPDIAVGLNQSARIRFQVEGLSPIDPVNIDLSAMKVTARDTAGREWSARMTGQAIATFDALPPGKYSLELELSAVSPPLVSKIPLPTMQISPVEEAFITIVLHRVAPRIWQKQPGVQK